MSFICDTCKKPAPKGVSPIVETIERPKTYANLDEKGQTFVVGEGHEIERELHHCPECKGVKLPEPTTPDLSAPRSFANGFAKKHARGCDGIKKIRKAGREDRTVPCPICEDIIKTFAAMPPQVLSIVLEA